MSPAGPEAGRVSAMEPLLGGLGEGYNAQGQLPSTLTPLFPPSKEDVSASYSAKLLLQIPPRSSVKCTHDSLHF